MDGIQLPYDIKKFQHRIENTDTATRKKWILCSV